jgi:radical SAM/Cys-rich protein
LFMASRCGTWPRNSPCEVYVRPVSDKAVCAEDVRESPVPTEPFARALARHGLDLVRKQTGTLQVNVGLLCNQVCRHCHLSAGPDREEIMDRETVDHLIGFAQRCSFQVMDITGGAPEMNPHLLYMIERFSQFVPRIMLRANLTAMRQYGGDGLTQSLIRHRVVIVASVPALNAGQLEAQRGRGVFQQTLDTLKMLNELGYGQPGSGLELSLVSNPSGAFLPVAQGTAEAKFRTDLGRRWGIVFNNLYTFANVPLGRFRQWLVESGNYDRYLNRLISSFNPCTIDGLMCRSLISVSWDGFLHDCDFHLAKGIPSGGVKTHVSSCEGPPSPGTPIPTADHCYACTAGAGFT